MSTVIVGIFKKKCYTERVKRAFMEKRVHAYCYRASRRDSGDNRGHDLRVVQLENDILVDNDFGTTYECFSLIFTIR